jgi:hypothetical protein
MAMTPRSTPIVTVPTPSHIGSSVTSVMVMALSAITRPVSAPRSSSRTTGSSGVFARRTNCGQELRPLTARDSTIAVRNEKHSRTIATPRITMATVADSIGSGCWSLCTPS